MKKFLIRISIFFILLLPFVGFTVFILVGDWLDYRENLKLDNLQTVFVCGHSQTETSLNPNFFPELKNFSLSGSPLLFTSLKAHDVVNANKGRKDLVMLLDICPNTLRIKDEDDFSRNPAKIANLLNAVGGKELSFLYWVHNPCDFRILPTQYALKRVQDFLKNKKRVLKGGFSERFAAGILTEFDIAKNTLADLLKIMDKNKIANGTINTENFYFDEVREIIGFLKENNVTPALMTTPLHETFLRSGDFKESFLAVMNSFAQETDCVYLNYIDAKFPDSDWYDFNHLNVYGAEKFSKQVRADLMKLGLISKK